MGENITRRGKAKSKVPFYVQVADLLNEGKTHAEIAQVFGRDVKWSYNQRRTAVRFGYDLRVTAKSGPGVSPDPIRAFQDKILQKGGKCGTLKGVIQLLTPEVRQWLIDQVPEEESLYVVVAAIINDAFHDDTEHG